MAIVDPHKRLYRKSGAYRAYVQLEVLPDGAPEFDFDENGSPYVQIAEHFCRFGLDEGVLCGKKWASRFVLDQHLRREHGLEATNQKNHTPAMIDLADEFYSALLYGHDWPGHGVGGQAVLGLRASRKRKQTANDVTEPDVDVEVDVRDPVSPNGYGPETKKAKQKRDLEFELRKVEIQKKMHAAELKALELKQELHDLKMRKG